MFNVKQRSSPEIVSDFLQLLKKPYNFRNNNILHRKKDKTVLFGIEHISSLAPKIWEILPGQLKNEICLNSFKIKLINAHVGYPKNT